MEPNLSLKHPQSWVTDVAIAEFDEPLRLKHYRVLDWDRNELSPQERIFLIDGEREGVVEPYKSEVSDKIEGMLGGRRYYTAYENTQTTLQEGDHAHLANKSPNTGGLFRISPLEGRQIIRWRSGSRMAYNSVPIT
jgi:hypothetical protein